MPNGFAISFVPSEWRLGVRDAIDPDKVGSPIVGRWLCLGPLAICWDFD